MQLNILLNPKFIVLKTGIIVFMIVSSKLLLNHLYIQSALLAMGMLAIAGINLIL